MFGKWYLKTEMSWSVSNVLIVCAGVCVHACVCVCLCKCVHACLCVCVCKCVWIHKYMQCSVEVSCDLFSLRPDPLGCFMYAVWTPFSLNFNRHTTQPNMLLCNCIIFRTSQQYIICIRVFVNLQLFCMSCLFTRYICCFGDVIWYDLHEPLIRQPVDTDLRSLYQDIMWY